jgi:predicted PurR-regulated permease PerM
MDPTASLAQRNLITRVLALVALGGLLLGALVVLKPFFAAGLFAIVFVLATWPLFELLRGRARLSNAWAATVLTLAVLLLVVLPMAWLVQSLVERGPAWAAIARGWLADGLPPQPAWLTKLPIVGTIAENYYKSLAADPQAVRDLLLRVADVARDPVVKALSLVAEGLLQLLLATFIAFFLYRDGEAIVASLRGGLARLAGSLSDEMLTLSQTTIQSVVLGLVGTAVAQGLIALVGFLIAGVPNALLLGGLTALLSILPGGTVVVWLGATIWLLSAGETGWAIFMALWGAGLVSTVDNVLRPMIISRGSDMGFALVFVGVIGGALSFGFVGIFIGPTLLALALALWKVWAAPSANAAPATPGANGSASNGSTRSAPPPAL